MALVLATNLEFAGFRKQKTHCFDRFRGNFNFRIAKSRPTKDLSQRSDLPQHYLAI